MKPDKVFVEAAHDSALRDKLIRRYSMTRNVFAALFCVQVTFEIFSPSMAGYFSAAIIAMLMLRFDLDVKVLWMAAGFQERTTGDRVAA